MSADEQGKEKAVKALNDFLRPEFINRVDEIIYFHRLTEENIRAIASLMLEDLRTAMAERGTALTWDESVITYLAEKGYSAAYGARQSPASHPEGRGGRHCNRDHRSSQGRGKNRRAHRTGRKDRRSRDLSPIYDKCLTREDSRVRHFLLVWGFSPRGNARRGFLCVPALRA